MRLVKVTDLVLNFAGALRALQPFLDLADVPWTNGQQYDNWDRIAEALFQSLVVEPCAVHGVGEQRMHDLKIARYGFTPSPGENAWIVVEGPQCAKMIDLLTVNGPFDHVRCTGLVALPLDKAEFAFVFKGNDGTIRKWNKIDLDAP